MIECDFDVKLCLTQKKKARLPARRRAFPFCAGVKCPGRKPARATHWSGLLFTPVRQVRLVFSPKFPANRDEVFDQLYGPHHDPHRLEDDEEAEDGEEIDEEAQAADEVLVANLFEAVVGPRDSRIPDDSAKEGKGKDDFQDSNKHGDSPFHNEIWDLDASIYIKSRPITKATKGRGAESVRLSTVHCSSQSEQGPFFISSARRRRAPI